MDVSNVIRLKYIPYDEKNNHHHIEYKCQKAPSGYQTVFFCAKNKEVKHSSNSFLEFLPLLSRGQDPRSDGRAVINKD